MNKGMGRMILAGVVGGLLVLAIPAVASIGAVPFARNADKVDKIHANGLLRIAGGSRDEANVFTGTGVVATTTITAPRNGFLMIEASSDAWNVDTYYYPICYLTVDGFAVPWSVRYLDHYDATESDCATGASGVIAKGPHVVNLYAEGDAFTHWGATDLTVVFVAFGPNGETVAKASDLVSEDAPTAAEFLREARAARDARLVDAAKPVARGMGADQRGVGAGGEQVLEPMP